MPNHEQVLRTGEESDSLELNKETLQDLDVPTRDAEVVRGGGRPTVSEFCQAASDVRTTNSAPQ